MVENRVSICENPNTLRDGISLVERIGGTLGMLKAELSDTGDEREEHIVSGYGPFDNNVEEMFLNEETIQQNIADFVVGLKEGHMKMLQDQQSARSSNRHRTM